MPRVYDQMTEQERREIMTFFRDREPSEVARLTLCFQDLVAKDAGALYDWKMARQMSRTAAASGVRYR